MKRCTRRKFLQLATAAAAGAAVGGCAKWRDEANSPPAPPGRDGRKLLVVLFGGGTRSRDTIDDPRHRWIPRLWDEMAPRGTLLTNMRVEGKVVHPNSAGSVVTGHWEWDDIDWTHPVDHPTIFELYRKARSASDLQAWLFAYASILSQAALSRAAGFGLPYAANVVEPPTIPRSTAERMDHWMRAAAGTGSTHAQLDAAHRSAELVRASSVPNWAGLRSDPARDFARGQFAAWQQATGTTSHDALLTDWAIAAMERFAPDVLSVMYGEIDCAHYGSWSRYVEAIRRTDELTWRLWRAVEQLPAYRGRTLMLILPDHGRELEESGGEGFVHHSDFYTGTGADEGCRRVWMLALGPSVRPGAILERPVPITAVAATGLEFLGLDGPRGAERSVLGRIAQDRRG